MKGCFDGMFLNGSKAPLSSG